MIAETKSASAPVAESFLFARDNLGLVQNEIYDQIADHLEVELAMPQQPVAMPDSLAEPQPVK